MNTVLTVRSALNFFLVGTSSGFVVLNQNLKIAIKRGVFYIWRRDSLTFFIFAELEGGVSLLELLGSPWLLALRGGGPYPRWPRNKVFRFEVILDVFLTAAYLG